MTPRPSLLVGGVTLLSALLGAQQQPPSAPQQFRSSTDLVLVDVSVLDKGRRPVRGLTAADFTVWEDGVAQRVAAFTAIELPDSEATPAKWMGSPARIRSWLTRS